MCVSATFISWSWNITNRCVLSPAVRVAKMPRLLFTSTPPQPQNALCTTTLASWPNTWRAGKQDIFRTRYFTMTLSMGSVICAQNFCVRNDFGRMSEHLPPILPAVNKSTHSSKRSSASRSLCHKRISYFSLQLFIFMWNQKNRTKYMEMQEMLRIVQSELIYIHQPTQRWSQHPSHLVWVAKWCPR